MNRLLLWHSALLSVLLMLVIATAHSEGSSAPAPPSAAASAGEGSYRFPQVVTIGAERIYKARDWINYDPFVYYAFDAESGAPILASDGKPEPFIKDDHHSALGIFSGRILLPIEKVTPNSIYLAPDKQPSIFKGAVIKGSGQRVELRYCCEKFRYSITPRKAFPESTWQAMEQLIERLSLFRADEVSTFSISKNCDFSAKLVGWFSRANPELATRWRVLYLVDELVEMTRCTGALPFAGGASIGDPLGDGSRLVSTYTHGFGRGLVFRVRESDGRPIGKVPDWLKVVSAEDVIAVRDRVRAEHRCPPLSEERQRFFGKDAPKDCEELIDIHNQAALETFTGRRTPRRLPTNRR